MSKEHAQKLAIDRAVAALKEQGVESCCLRHGFDVSNGLANLRIFGMDATLVVEPMEITVGGKPLKPADQILLLHYLLCDLPIIETGQHISFRELTGGQFYWGPFQARTVNPLVERIGNDLDTLRKNLGKFDWEPVDLGDFGAKIHALGNLYLTIVWHLGDEEFPASVDVLFDACIKRVYEAEDAVVLASRICIGCLF